MAKKDFKKELSKELMYKKIMPSAVKPEPSEQADIGFEPSASSVQRKSVRPDENAQPQVHDHNLGASPVVQVPQSSSVPSSSYYPAASAAAPAVAASSEPLVINQMELFVQSRVDEVIAKFHSCNCSRCKKGVIAVALNKLPPKYVEKSDDPTLDISNNEYSAQVLTALIQAVLQVRANPRHD